MKPWKTEQEDATGSYIPEHSSQSSSSTPVINHIVQKQGKNNETKTQNRNTNK